jgi:stage V sporulation protein G
MRLTDIRIKLCETHNQNNRLKAFCALTFDNTFVIRDVKLIEGNDGLFLAMPSRKLADHCPRCSEKNHLRARYCNNCGAHLDENRYQRYQNGNGNGHNRLKLHADIAHPINAECRQAIEKDVVTAFHDEVEKSKQPGYVPPSLDGEDIDFFDMPNNRMRLRPTGTTSAR